MANTLQGAPTIAQIQLLTDQQSALLKAAYASLGLNAPGESGTISAQCNTTIQKTLGDGTSSFPGLGNPQWAAQVKDSLQSLRGAFRWDIVFGRAMRGAPGLLSSLDNQVSSFLPSGWTFTNASYLHAFDNWLLRANGAYGVSAAANGTALTTPASAGTVTATNASGGAIPVCASGSAPRIVHTLVGQYDWLETPPSPQATQTAIVAPNNAYTYQIASTVPTGVKKVRIYRGFVGGGSSIYYWDQDVAVTAGASYPAITIKQPDILLRQDWIPPSWLSCLVLPEIACLWALAYATQQIGGIDNVPPAFSSSNMLTPQNVALNPSNGFLGLGNVAQHGQFGSVAVTGATAGTFTAGAIQGANVAATNVQGFAGGIGLQARVTTALAATGTVTLSYTYYDATNGWGNIQTQTGVNATFGGTTVGSLATWTIPAGRIVLSVTPTAYSGFSSATGAFVFESPEVRAH